MAAGKLAYSLTCCLSEAYLLGTSQQSARIYVDVHFYTHFNPNLLQLPSSCVETTSWHSFSRQNELNVDPDSRGQFDVFVQSFKIGA